MSQWTHVIGVIRFEDFNLNCWPEPADKDRLVRQNMDKVHKAFQLVGPPAGSEGPLSFDTILTSRGPTVVLTGDLRDFGADDCTGIVEWLNEVVKLKTIDFTFVRDAIIHCNVEYSGDLRHFIIFDHDVQEFKIIELGDLSDG